MRAIRIPMSRTLGVPHIKMLSYTAIIIKNVAGCMILDHNGIVTLSSVMIFASRNGQSIVVENEVYAKPWHKQLKHLVSGTMEWSFA